MEQLPPVPLDEPATYRIQITGCLESDLAERRWGLTAKPVKKRGKPEQTVLFGEVADQAALVGIINALYNYGHTVVKVKRFKTKTELYNGDDEMKV